MRILIDYDDKGVTRMLQRLIDAGMNPSPALKGIGDDLIDSTKKRFETASGPDGTPWARNSEETTLKRKNKDKLPLTDGGTLMDEINFQLISEDTLEVGSPAEYAGTQQFGAKQGQYGRSTRNSPIPWGDIPAREFIGISDEDEEKIIEEINKFLLDTIA